MTIEDISKKFTGIKAGQNPTQTFNDFTNIMSLVMASAIHDTEWEAREEEYKESIKRYNAKGQSKMAEIYADIIELYEEKATIVDALGPIYEKLGTSNKNTGQFFTPYHIAKILADAAIDEETLQKEIEVKGYVTLSEPTCGSGVNMLAACQRIRELGYNPQTQAVVHANDIDINCVHMTYMQLSMWGIPAIVTHGDAMKCEEWRRFQTPAYILNKNKGILK